MAGAFFVVKEEKIMLKDNEIINFDGEFAVEDFQDYLKEVSTNTKWVTTDVNKLVASYMDATDLSATPAESEMDTATEGTKIFIKGDHLPKMGVRECALKSLRERLGLTCRAMEKISAQTAAEIMTAVAADLSADKALVSIVDGKINAVLSADAGNNSYAVFDSEEVFCSAQDMIEELTESEDTEASKFTAQWTYSGYQCRWETPIRHQLRGKRYKTEVDLSTSDTGDGCVRIGASLVDGNKRIPFMTDQTVEHRKRNTGMDVLESHSMAKEAIQDISKKLPDQMNRSIGKLRMLEMISISNPIETMNAMAESVKLPKRQYVPVIKEYAATMGCAPTTAMDLYIQLSKVLQLYQQKNEKFENQAIVKGNILKLLGADWAKRDVYDEKVRALYM